MYLLFGVSRHSILSFFLLSSLKSVFLNCKVLDWHFSDFLPLINLNSNMTWLVFSKVSDTVIPPASPLVKIRPRKVGLLISSLSFWKMKCLTPKMWSRTFDMNNSKCVSQFAPGKIWAKWNTYSPFSLSGYIVYLNPMFVKQWISCIIYPIKKGDCENIYRLLTSWT